MSITNCTYCKINFEDMDEDEDQKFHYKHIYNEYHKTNVGVEYENLIYCEECISRMIDYCESNENFVTSVHKPECYKSNYGENDD